MSSRPRLEYENVCFKLIQNKHHRKTQIRNITFFHQIAKKNAEAN